MAKKRQNGLRYWIGAGRLYYRRYDQAKAQSEALYRNLNADRIELGFFDLPPHLVEQRYLKAKKQEH